MTDRNVIIVYKYRLGAPHDWAHDCDRQLIAQARLWDTLVDIDLAARQRYYAALASVAPDLARAEQDLAAQSRPPA